MMKVIRAGRLTPEHDGIDEATAEDLLRRDVETAVRAVLRLIGVPLAVGQFDVLVSLPSTSVYARFSPRPSGGRLGEQLLVGQRRRLDEDLDAAAWKNETTMITSSGRHDASEPQEAEA